MLFFERRKIRSDIKKYIAAHPTISSPAEFDKFKSEAKELSEKIGDELSSITSSKDPDIQPVILKLFNKLFEFFNLTSRIYDFEQSLFLSMSEVNFDINNPDDVKKFLIYSAIKDDVDKAPQDSKDNFITFRAQASVISDREDLEDLFSFIENAIKELVDLHIPLIKVLHDNYSDIFPNEKGKLKNLNDYLSKTRIKKLYKKFKTIRNWTHVDKIDSVNQLLEKIVKYTFITGIIFACIGLLLLALEGTVETNFNIFGQDISTRNSGLVAMFLAVIMITSTIKRVINSIKK